MGEMTLEFVYISKKVCVVSAERYLSIFDCVAVCVCART